MRLTLVVLLTAAVGLAATGTAAGADNTAPLAEAGVDQTVPVNSTVYLDATGSTDPDGEITAVAWSIETPGGDTMAPDCEDCRRTEFDASALGQYTVTVTVTDDDGATRSDTLYVTSTARSGPDVSLSGPSATTTGSNATLTANVSAEQASLQTLTWLVDGTVVERTSLDGASASHSLSHSFDNEVPVRAVVYDTLGNRGSATHRVSVVSGDSGTNCYRTSCKGDGSGADFTRTVDGVTTISDTNDKPGLQTYDDEGNLVTIKDPEGNPNIESGPNAGWKIDGRLSSLDEDALKSTDDSTDESSGSGSPSSWSDDSDSSFADDVQEVVNNLLGGDGGGSDDDGSSSDSGDNDSGGGGGGWLNGGFGGGGSDDGGGDGFGGLL